jgi:hypothetical protein
LLPHGMQHVRDVSQATTLDLLMYLLDDLPDSYAQLATDAPEWMRRMGESLDVPLVDPLDRYLAWLFYEAVDYCPSLLERLRQGYPERLFL